MRVAESTLPTLRFRHQQDPVRLPRNRIIGGGALQLSGEKGKTAQNGQIIKPPIEKPILIAYLETHCIPVLELNADDFASFTKARQKLLLERVRYRPCHWASAEPPKKATKLWLPRGMPCTRLAIEFASRDELVGLLACLDHLLPTPAIPV